MSLCKLIISLVGIIIWIMVTCGVIFLAFYSPYRVVMSFLRPNEGFFEFWIWFTVCFLIWGIAVQDN